MVDLAGTILYQIAQAAIDVSSKHSAEEVENFSERGNSFSFSQWGCDQCADVMLHLFRSQLLPLTEYLGLPEAGRNKVADSDAAWC